MSRPKAESLIRISIILIIGFVIFQFLNFRTTPMKLETVFIERLGKGFKVQFADMDGDGVDEMVKGQWTSSIGLYGIQVALANGSLVDQWNIKMDPDDSHPYFFTGDYNEDNLNEIFCVYTRDDQIFMDIIFPYDDSKSREYSQIFVDTIKNIPLHFSNIYSSKPIFADLTGDGKNEIIFSVIGQYKTYYPRKLYALNLETRQFIKSEQFNNMINQLFVFNKGANGDILITGMCGSSDNNQPGYDFPLSDSCGWLMIFDKNLELIDPSPPMFPGKMGRVEVFTVEEDSGTELIGYATNIEKKANDVTVFKTTNLSEIDSVGSIPIFDNKIGFQIFEIWNNNVRSFVGLSGHGRLLFLDDNLSLIRTKKLDGIYNLYKPHYFEQNGNALLVLKEQGRSRIRIFSHTGRELVDQDLQLSENAWNYGSSNYLGENYMTILSNGGEEVRYYSYETNYWHYLKWFGFGGIIFSLYLFSWFTLYLQKRSARKYQKIIIKMRKLELATIKSQLDPHFAFNSLNVLSYLSSVGDNQGIEKFTHHFSKMFRRQLEGSDKPSIQLCEELDFVQHYMELQKLRFDIPIHFDIDIATGVNMNLQIPKMMIHTHIENAIKHGLIPVQGGEIKIWIQMAKKNTIIKIIDNGVGRTSESNSPNEESSTLSSGKGLKVLNQLYDLFYQLYKVKIHQKIIDLKDKDGNPSGTEIRITL